MPRFPARELIQLLETEAHLLMAGKLKELEALAPDKIRLEAALSQSQCKKSEAKLIKEAAEINARLFQAAIDGLKSANSRLSEVAKVRSELSLYTKNGAKNTLHKSGEAMEWKA